MDETQLLVSRGKGDEGPPTYQSFDNPAVALDDEETHLTEVKQPLPPGYHDDQNSTISTVPRNAGQVVMGTATGDADNVSIVTIDDEGQDERLSGEEILYRLRLAHIYGNLDWPRHLRSLTTKSREDVHMQILDTLREQPIDIHQKKKLSRYIRDRFDTASVSSLTRTEARSRQDRQRRRNYKVDTGIWKGNITKISAYFGSHVASYFVFLRFLVYLDLLLAVLLFGLVTLPQILSDKDAAPEALSGDFGVVSTSIMFFGAYSDTRWGYYDRPLAFFLTWAAAHILCFLIIVASMYIKYSLSKRSETDEDEFPFSARVFCSWDHTLSRREGAALRTKAIVTQTKEMVREERSQGRLTCCRAIAPQRKESSTYL